MTWEIKEKFRTVECYVCKKPFGYILSDEPISPLSIVYNDPKCVETFVSDTIIKNLNYINKGDNNGN